MTQGAFSAGAGAIQAGAKATNQARVSVDASINKVDQLVQAVGPGWQSAGSAAMLRTVEEWLTTSRAISAELDTFEAKLIATDTDYVATEDEHVNTFQNVMSSMERTGLAPYN